jgi:hypothetical protein
MEQLLAEQSEHVLADLSETTAVDNAARTVPDEVAFLRLSTAVVSGRPAA